MSAVVGALNSRAGVGSRAAASVDVGIAVRVSIRAVETTGADVGGGDTQDTRMMASTAGMASRVIARFPLAFDGSRVRRSF